MRHPLQAIPAGKSAAVFVPLLVATLSLMAILNIAGEPLNTAAAPAGIVSFELAGSVSQASRILDSWDAAARARAGFSLGLDFLFLLAYSTTIGLACVWGAGIFRAGGWRIAGVGIALAWGQWLAALLDAVENAALVVMLFGSVAEPWPAIAQWCAVPKFGLVLAGLLWAALSAAAHMLGRLRR